MGRFARALICAASAWLAMGRTAVADTGAGTDPGDALHSIAFFYGKHPPLDALSHYDAAVIEPDHGFAPPIATVPPSKPTWYAYVSVGEVNPSRPFYGEIPPGWLHGTNDAWQSSVVDQTAPGWPGFLSRYARLLSARRDHRRRARCAASRPRRRDPGDPCTFPWGLPDLESRL